MSSSSSNQDSNDQQIQLPADLFERNPNILKAEVDLLSTPHSMYFRDAAYASIQNVQAQCNNDFVTNCMPKEQVVTLDQFMSILFQQRRTTESTEAIPQPEQARISHLLRPILSVKSMYMGGPKLTKIESETVRSVKPLPSARPVPITMFSSASPETQRTLRGTLSHRRLHGFWHGRHSDSDSDSGSDSGSDSDEEEEEGRHRRHHNRDESSGIDTTFMGSLGYGPNGDMCIYQNFNTLSQPCQGAIQQHFELRQQFWTEEESHQSCHAMAGFGLLLGAFILGSVVRRCIYRKRFQQVRKVMDAINANPALKAAVEAEAGVTMVITNISSFSPKFPTNPPPPPPGFPTCCPIFSSLFASVETAVDLEAPSSAAFAWWRACFW